MAPFLHVERLSHHSQCHCYHFIYCSAPLTFASYVMSHARQDIPSYYFYSLFFILIFISFSSSPSPQNPLPHQFTFSIMTTCKVIELQPTSRYLSFRLRLICDCTCAETRFRLSAKGTSAFKSAGASVQSTTGSRGVRISGSNAGYTMFRGSVKGTGYSLHSPVSPSLPLPFVTMRHHISTGLYPTISLWCKHCDKATWRTEKMNGQ